MGQKGRAVIPIIIAQTRPSWQRDNGQTASISLLPVRTGHVWINYKKKKIQPTFFIGLVFEGLFISQTKLRNISIIMIELESMRVL